MSKVSQSDTNELNFILRFVADKMDSLQKDVLYCLQPPFAPMPAILWCVSCIDLLGALYSGRASHYGTTEKSRRYMEELMGYSPEQVELILDVFRHKLVHLADPAPLSSYKHKTVAWEYDHNFTLNHVTLVDVKNAIPAIKPPWVNHVNIDQVFTLGITQFKI